MWKIVKRRVGIKNPPIAKSNYERKLYLKYKERSREKILASLERVNKTYNLKWNKVAIRCVHTRWASCSSKGNLNFSFLLLFVSDELLDYVVAHELSHLAHFNHSELFWNEVAKYDKNYIDKIAKLKVLASTFRVQIINHKFEEAVLSSN